MRYVKSINELWGRSKSNEPPKEKTTREMPKVFGNKFEVQIDAKFANIRSNVFDSIYNHGVSDIKSSNKISEYISYYFTKMSNEQIADMLEKLSSDYNSVESFDCITFKLNKSQLIEFIDLIKKASTGVSI